MEKVSIVLKTFFGFEEILAQELHELGYPKVELLNRAVKIEGTWEDVYKVNLMSRCAISVLVEIKKFQLTEENDLYKQAKTIPWNTYFDVKKTIAVKGAIHSSYFKHSQFPFLLIKDAIVDVFREQTGERPDVNIKTPQIVIDLYIREKEATLSINTSGLPLFQRGYRQSTGEAPLNEVVAACLLRMSGWDRKMPLIDPFCGSGTILIEAALLATGIPSVIERQHFAFKNLKNFNEEKWEELRDSFPKFSRELDVQIIGSDISAEMILIAKRNCQSFSFGRFISLQNKSIDEMEFPEGPAMIITNPPYGERLDAEIDELYATVGTTFKSKLQGYTCGVISSSESGFNAISLKHSKRFKVYNGDIECNFRLYEMYAGSKKIKSDSVVIE